MSLIVHVHRTIIFLRLGKSGAWQRLATLRKLQIGAWRRLATLRKLQSGASHKLATLQKLEIGASFNSATVKSIILCKSLNVVISSGHHAHYTCKNVRALFSQFSWKSINIEPIKRSAEAMFG